MQVILNCSQDFSLAKKCTKHRRNCVALRALHCDSIHASSTACSKFLQRCNATQCKLLQSIVNQPLVRTDSLHESKVNIYRNTCNLISGSPSARVHIFALLTLAQIQRSRCGRSRASKPIRIHAYFYGFTTTNTDMRMQCSSIQTEKLTAS